MTTVEEPIVMYCYFNDKKHKIWTCNSSLAFTRAKVYGSQVYEVVIK